MHFWVITHSVKDGYVLSIGTKSFFWTLVGAVGEFLAHRLGKFLPMLPIPIVHINDDFCEDSRRIHLHNPYRYWGWTLEDFLCATVDQFFTWKEFASEKRFLSFSLSPQNLDELCRQDERTRDFRQEMTSLEEEEKS